MKRTPELRTFGRDLASQFHQEHDELLLIMRLAKVKIAELMEENLALKEKVSKIQVLKAYYKKQYQRMIRMLQAEVEDEPQPGSQKQQESQDSEESVEENRELDTAAAAVNHLDDSTLASNEDDPSQQSNTLLWATPRAPIATMNSSAAAKQ